MLHRAILGSFERFIGILIEQHAGKLPLWLSPVQMVVATITSDVDDYAKSVADKCQALGLRAKLDLRNEKISYKIREHSLQYIPIILVVGKQEAQNQQVAIRRFGSDNHQSMMALDEALTMLENENKFRK